MIKNVVQCLFFIFIATVQGQVSDFKNTNFKISDSIAEVNKGRDLRNLPLLAYDLTYHLNSDVEKFRAIYKWVCTNIKNSFFDSEENIYKRKKYKNNSLKLTNWNRKISKRVISKLLNEQKTVCTGYVYLVKQLCFLSDINCVTIDGYSRSVNLNLEEPAVPNHSWNAVQLNGKWYLCDATWSSGFSYSTTGEFVFDYGDEYFLARPEVFIKNHYPVNLEWTLLKKNFTLTEYINAPLIYKSAYTYQIIPVLPKKMFLKIKKNKIVVFELLEFGKKNKNLNIQIIKGLSIKNYKIENPTSFKHTFAKNGKYDVHVRIKDQVICTYVIKVN